ncbi:His-Xaa-Ser repeat protein HxsA2 [Insolitispirillum peregrinum]|uniref:His-Xaa-Ser repeat protein HxsA2 n=1 Tax=Insolitispirillum peregrinum TaxID=80876 RepID=UPI00361262A9
MKRFLGSFAAIAASFSATAQAAIAPEEKAAPVETTVISSSSSVTEHAFQVPDGKGDLMSFVLRPSGNDGMLFASHQSHASHVSHGSHSSHYSSR